MNNSIKSDEFSNKTVVITGGCGLIGNALIESFNECGAEVVNWDISLNTNNSKNEIKCDISNEEEIIEAVSKTEREFGKIDVLINNAYPRNSEYGKRIENVSLNSWNQNLSSHLGGYFATAKHVAMHMQENAGGSIINMGSIYGVVGPDFSIYENTEMTMPVEYSAIKGGIINLTRYLASYFGKYNIRVNAVSPGGIFDEQNQQFVKRYEAKVPLGRMAKPSDVSGAVRFLASDAASYITGQNLIVDGGWTAC